MLSLKNTSFYRRNALYLVIVTAFFSVRCSIPKNQARQVTGIVKGSQLNADKLALTKECEIQIITESLELLAKSKAKWSNLNFKDPAAVSLFQKWMKEEVSAFTKNNRNYLKIKGQHERYVLVESQFYKVFFDSLPKDPSGFSIESLVNFFAIWR